MSINILLKCYDIAATKSYYKEMLGFEVIKFDQKTITAKKEDCILLFTSENLWNGNPTCTGTIYLFINNIDAYFESIKDKVNVIWPLQDMPYGTREFGIRDNHGYQIAFAQNN